MYPAGAGARQGVGTTEWATRRRSWTTRASTTWRSPRTASTPADLIPKHRPVRQVGDDVGLQADPECAHPGRRDGRRSIHGLASRTDTRGCASRRRRRGGSDPGEQTEAVGDADAVQATTLGLKNLQRVGDMLLSATTTKTGEPYDDLDEVYGRLVGQWTLEMNHVASLVGGVESQQRACGPGRRPVHACPAGTAGGGAAVPACERVYDTAIPDQA